MHVPHLSIAIAATALALGTPHRSDAADAVATATPTRANPQAQAPHSRYEQDYQRRTYKGTGDSELNYGWLAPLNAKPGEKFPLVICLHGSGGSVKASAVLAREPMREQYPAFVMVPEADRPFTWAKTDAFSRGVMENLPEKLPVLIETIQALLKTEAIDPARIYITGQSMGGIGSWGANAQHPKLFAAAVPVCGAWNIDDVPKMKGVAVWAFHGEKDPTVPVHFSRELTEALTKAGGTAKYTEYPGVGHNSWLQAYDEGDMWKWLFAQRKGAAAN